MYFNSHQVDQTLAGIWISNMPSNAKLEGGLPYSISAITRFFRPDTSCCYPWDQLMDCLNQPNLEANWNRNTS